METLNVCNDIKTLLARNIEYINYPHENDNVLAFVDTDAAPSIIFLYFYPSNKNSLFYYNEYGESTDNSTIFDNPPDGIRKYFESKGIPQKYFEYPRFDFVFNIIHNNQTIYTRTAANNQYKGGNKYRVADIYTNTDMRKILTDLIKNGIITDKYKLNIENNTYLVSDILTKKNQPIKQSKRGNIILFHGTTIDNWQSIKKHGGLNPNYNGSTRKDYGYIKGISDKSIYLTSSFNIAKSYATSYTTSDTPVILMVEVPDMNRLYPDDDYMMYEINNIFEQFVRIVRGLPLTIKENSDFLEMKKYLWGNENPYFKINDTKVDVSEMQSFARLFLNAILNRDFNMIVEELGLSGDELDIYKKMYKLIYDKLGNYFYTTNAIRNSLNSSNTSNAVAYRGRIPLSYILGAYDINGNKIE